MSPAPPENQAALIQRLLGYTIFVGAVLALILIIFVAKFEFLSNNTGLVQAEIARNVARGDGLTTDTIRPLAISLAGDKAERVLFSGPLYPLLLSLPMRVLGTDGNAVALTSMAFIVLTLVLVGIIAARLFNARVAIGSVALLILSVPFVQQGVVGDQLAFLSFILTLLFSVLLLWRESPRAESQWWTVGVGALVGLAWLTRHEMIALLPTVLVFWLIADRQRFWRRTLWTLVPVVVLAGPWSAYNSILLERPVSSPECYMLLSDTTLYPDDTLVRKAAPAPEHPLVLAARHPGMIYLKVRERLVRIYHRIPMLGNPFVTAFFLVGAVLATAKRRLSLIHWTVLLAVALTGFMIALYTNNVTILICFAPFVTMLAVFSFTDLLEPLDENPPTGEAPSASTFGRKFRYWIGLASATRGTGRVISFGLVLLALVVACPMVDYLFARPPARSSPVVRATELLGEEPYDLIMTDVPSAVTWHADTRTLILPDNQRQMEAIEQAGFRPDAVYLRARPGLRRDMFPGFEWVERRDLPGLLWVRAEDTSEADGGDGDE